jgi:hypothetical protein
MVPKTRPSIKAKVLNEWLQGIHRNKIARDNGIGSGTLTSICQD